MLSFFMFERSHIPRDKKETFLTFLLHALSNSIVPDDDEKNSNE
jgi:hypothetical protein